jgi:hypothetical protein
MTVGYNAVGCSSDRYGSGGYSAVRYISLDSSVRDSSMGKD